MSDEPVDLGRLYDECVERLLNGETVDIGALAAAHPDHADAIHAQLSRLAKTAPGPGEKPAGKLPYERLGDFRLIHELGAGGMGIVFLAEQVSLRRKVALKVIRPAFMNSPTSRARFAREAAAVAKLKHPNIVDVYTAGEEEGALYLAMELVPGAGLDDLLEMHARQGKRMPVSDAVRYAAQIARALQSAHDAGLVHRDVKPSNVRVTPEGRALLLDFGLARDKEAIRLTLSGEFQGTPYYTAPEQIRFGGGSTDEVDGRADVFALGVTLYECLTGDVPFRGRTIEQVIHGILNDPPPQPRRSNAALSRDLETVVLKALEKDPERRYSTAAALADDLEAVLALRPIAARPPGAISQTIARLKRRPALAIALIAAVTAIAGFLLKALIDVRVRRAAIVREVALADVAIASEQYDAAIEAAHRALALDPRDSGALERLALGEAKRVGSRARSEFAQARDGLAALQDQVKTWLALDAKVRPLVAARTARYLSADENARVEKGEPMLEELRQAIDARELDVLRLARSAHYLDPELAGTEDLLADLYMARFRAAIAQDDEVEADRYAALAAKHDANDRYAAEIAGDGSVAIDVDPAGAEVHLFRYVDQSKLDPEKGERRLVPIGLDAAAKPPRPYGTWVLRVAKDGAGLAAGDLVLGVAGAKVRNTLLVSTGSGDVQRFDRLVAIDGRPARDEFEADWLATLPPRDTEHPGKHRFAFERPGADPKAPEKIEVFAASLREAGIEAVAPAVIVRGGRCKVEVFSGGEIKTIELADGCEVRATAAPLFACRATLAGAAPLSKRVLPAGSYLALIRAPGREEMRLPFVVGRSADVKLSAKLLAQGSVPAGFVAVAPGPFRSGGDPASGQVDPPATPEVPAFCVMEREVTLGEYAGFLNDAASADARVPRSGLGPLLVRDGAGRFVAAPDQASLPVHGVSWDDAQAYAEWKTAKARAQGEPWTFALPRSLEWEKAARGADGRTLVCGRHFVAHWLSSRHARPIADLAPVLSFPADESPYGAYDLGGSMNEWCDDVVGDDPDARVVRGGSWSDSAEAAFHATYRQSVLAAATAASIGFRLVARPIE